MSCFREENIRYIEVWVLFQQWKMEAKTAISSLTPRNLCQRELRDEFLIREMLKIPYSSLWAVCVLVWDIAELQRLKS